MVSFEDYIDGVRGNSRSTLQEHDQAVSVLRTLDSAYAEILPRLTGTREGTAIFAVMSHAAFLAGVELVTSGQIPSSCMVFRGCLENALYGFYLFHHPELKQVWMGRHDSAGAKKRVREEFPVGRMEKFLLEESEAIGTQFELVYDTTIDFGAHPNMLAFTSHLMPIEGSTDQVWQYINLQPVDLLFALRVAAMAGVNALNIFALMFTKAFAESACASLLSQAHVEFQQLPETWW